MLLGSFIGLAFLFLGVLAAPLDDPNSSGKKKNDPAPSTTLNDYQISSDPTLIKKNLIPSVGKDEAASSLMKDDQGSKLVQTVDDKLASEKTADEKGKNNVNTLASPKTEDQNNDDAETKDKKDHEMVEVSPDIADNQIDNEIDHEKVKEILVKAVSTMQKNGKQTSSHEIPAQKPGESNLIGNFIYEIMQAPIYFLNAVKDLIGGMLGIKQPVVVTTTSITASTP